MSTKSTQDSTADNDFRMMVQIDMEMAKFHSNWTHCDYIATYLARTISHNRSDSVLFANLFSSALNELLEITFRSRNTSGVFACKILRQANIDRVELSFSCSEDERRSFEEVVARVRSDDAKADYMNALSSARGPSRDLLLVELAVSYNAQVSIDIYGDNTVTLSVDLPLGGMTH
jgi:hypothetical protein